MTHRFFRFAALADLGHGSRPALRLQRHRRSCTCPWAVILSDAAKRTVLKPGAAGADPAAALYTVELTGIDTSCQTDARRGETDSDLTLSFRATRAPSAQAARYTVPYFVAANQAERVLNRRAFAVEVNFAPGATTVTFQVTVNSNILRLENGHLPTEYQYMAGLELSDAERAYLQAMSRYTP